MIEKLQEWYENRHANRKDCKKRNPSKKLVRFSKRAYEVMIYEGNMGDEREFGEKATQIRIDIFLESLDLKMR